MATYYVDGTSGSDAAAGTTGAPWKTLAKAYSASTTGDTIRVRTATYYEKLNLAKANQTWEADTGHTPTIDGRYGPALFGAAGYKNEDGAQIGANELPSPIQVNALKGNWVVVGEFLQIVTLGAGVTVRGFIIRNVCGRPVGMAGNNSKLINCHIDFCYSGAIILESCKNALVQGCTITRASVKLFDKTSQRKEDGTPQQRVTTAIICRGEDNTIENNTIAYNFGEGVSAAKRGIRQTLRYNTAHTNMHCGFYVNGAVSARVYGNIGYFCDNLYSTPLGGKDQSGRLVVLGDEKYVSRPELAETSTNTFVYNNLFVGGTLGFEIGGTSSQRAFNMEKSYIGYNTFVGRPATRGYVFQYGVAWASNSVFECNIFLKHPSQTGDLAEIKGSTGGKVLHRNNVSNAPLQGELAGSNSIVVGTNATVLANPFNRQINGTFEYKSTSLPNVTTTFTASDYDVVESSPARGKGSDNRVLTANGLTLPVINIDRWKAARTNMDLSANPPKFYDAGSDEYGSDDPPPEDDAIVASFNYTPTGGIGPLTVQFTDTSIETGTADIDGWLWEFGDGTTSTSQNPSHVYAARATPYVPKLTVTDASLSLSSTYTGPSITVTAPITGSVTARFTRTPAAGEAGVTNFAFTDTSTRTGDAVINSWAWDFRDGTTSTLQNPSHIYTVAGTYRPRLTVRDTVRGYQNTFTGPDTVVTTTPVDDGIEAAFTQSHTAGQAPLAVTFTDTSLEAGAANIDTWSWDYGDGFTGTTQNPVHTYATPGKYTPVLTVSDSTLGLIDTFTGLEITVTAAPPPDAGEDIVIRQTRAALSTSNGNQTFSQAGLNGLTPKSARFIVTGATADGTAADGELFGYGATAGNAQWAAAVASQHGVANTNTARKWTEDACIILVDGDGAELVRATFVEWTANGVTVNVTWTGTPTAYLVTVVLGAGTDYQAWVGSAGIGDAYESTVATPGFEATAVHAVSTWGRPDTAETGLQLSLGIAHRLDGQWVMERYLADGLADAANYTRFYDDRVAHNRPGNVSGQASVKVSAWGTTTFTLYSTNQDINSTLLLMAENYGDARSRLALVDTATATGNTDYALDWDPQYVEHILSARQGLGSASDGSTSGTIGVQSVTADGEYSNEVSSENGSATTNEQSLTDNQFIVVGHTGATLASGATTLGTAKYSINYATAPATALKLISLAVEEGQAGGGGGAYVTAEFTADVVTGTVPLRVQFSDLSDSTNPITTWLWDFGDGNYSSAQNPVHIYNSGQAFNVSLTVSDGTISDTEEKTGYITPVERIAREIIIGPWVMKPIREDSTPVTYRDPEDAEGGYIEGALSLNAIRLSADPEIPVALPEEISIYHDAATGDLKVKYTDDTDGTVTVT